MKIGGHGFPPWIKYYFEIDLQPARDVDSNASSSGARVIDWRVDLARWDWGGLRMGQWKVEFNRDWVDSWGSQQLAGRLIVSRILTVDRRVGLQLRGVYLREVLQALIIMPAFSTARVAVLRAVLVSTYMLVGCSRIFWGVSYRPDKPTWSLQNSPPGPLLMRA